jgi:hypothetical protein
MKWYYESNGHPHGPIDEAELRQLREDGKLLDQTLVWRQGMLDWAPINEVNDFVRLPEVGVSRKNQLLSQTTNQPDPVVHSDEHTGDSLGEQELPPASAPGTWRPEWEHVDTTGPLGAFATSLREICLDPDSTFSQFPVLGGWGKPLVFLAICEVIGNLMLGASVKQVAHSASPAIAFLKQAVPMEKGSAIVSSLAILLTLPLAIVVKTALIHVSLKIVAQTEHGFATTFRTLCYAFGASSMLWGIPFLAVTITTWAGESSAAVAAFCMASFVIGVWSIWINIRAIASAHRVSVLRAIAALLLPPFVFVTAMVLFLGGISTMARH